MREPTHRDLAYNRAGSALMGAGLGRPLNHVSLDDGVDWAVPAVVLSKWGDFLDFAHTEAMISYGGAFAEALAAADARDPLRVPDGEAREIVETLLEEWRGDHPEVVAYVEEWLDWPALRANTEEALLEVREGVSLLAERLLERGSLTGAETEGVLAEAIFRRAVKETTGERRVERTEDEGS